MRPDGLKMAIAVPTMPVVCVGANVMGLSSFAKFLIGLFCSALCLAMDATGTTSIAQTTLQTDLKRSPKDGGPRRWEVVADGLQLHASPSVDAKVTGILANGAVLSNLGCSGSADQVWCKVRPFRGGTAGYAAASHLRPAEGPDGVIPMGIDDSNRRAAKRKFDAKGEISCAQERGQKLGTCVAAVARSGGGDATVVVTFPNGFARRLYFVHGEFVSASATMSGVGRDTDWRRENGLHVIRVDDQRYELPDALLFKD